MASLLCPSPVVRTRLVFLRIVAFCYSSAFSSLYPQVRGLYGQRGILPVREGTMGTKWPDLLGTTNRMLGLNPEQTMELVCLMGTALSVAMNIWPR